MARFNLPFHPGPRARKILKYAGYVLLALVTFVFALQLTFPYHRVKDKVVEALAGKYEVTIASVERGIMPGRMYFKNVTLRSRVEKASDVPTTFFINEIEVDLGLLPLIRGVASVDIEAKIGPGTLSGNIAISKSLTQIDLEGDGLPSAMLPMKDAIGLPMSGKLDFSVDLSLPIEKAKTSPKPAPNWQKAEGAIAFDCLAGCTFGDGKTKLKLKAKNARSQAFAEDGIEFGMINVDSMSARVSIKSGRLELTKFDTKSKDGELHVDFSLDLAPKMDDSMVAGCLRFKGSEELMKREPKTHAALSTTGANIGPDGLFHIRLDGQFGKMKRLAQTCGDAVKNIPMDDPSGGGNTGPSRPNLTVQPPEDKPATPPPATPPPAVEATPPTPSTTVPTGDVQSRDEAAKEAAAKEAAAKEAAGAPANGTTEGSAATPPGEPVPTPEGGTIPAETPPPPPPN